jgi:surfactin synthase thioesterase subunit
LATEWIVTPRPSPRASVRLILVPDAGGSASTFRGWSERLSGANLGFVQMPGRGDRLHEPPVESLQDAARHVADQIGMGAASPTVLFGHGLGALIAFETARRLQARHWPVLALFVSGQGGPARGTAPPGLADLPVDQLVAQLRQRHVLPPDLLSDPDAMRLFLHVIRADVAMAEGYRYEPAHPLGCPIVACDALADPHVSRSDIEGWKRETTGRFSIHRFGGDRSYIHREEEALTALIANHLSVMVGALARSALLHR